MKKKYLALLTIFALLLTLLTACGGENGAPAPDPAPAPAEAEEQTPLPPVSDPAPAETEPEPSEAPAPTEADPAGEDPDTVDVSPDEPAPEPPEPTESEPEAEPESAPEPEPEPEPEETIPEDGTYTAAVTLEGGTGRATIESPAVLHCESGQFRAVIVWSSPNFDYMKVDGEKYELVSEPGGNSIFEIPVSAFEQKLDVIADTVAMSEPHEVEYTLYFDSATLQKQ